MRYKGPRLEEMCFDDMLLAGEHVDTYKESERWFQQARDGHKKRSTKAKSNSTGTGTRVKKHHKKSKYMTALKEALTTIAKPVTSSLNKSTTRKPWTPNNTCKVSQEQQDRCKDNNLCLNVEKMGIHPKTVIKRCPWINLGRSRLSKGNQLGRFRLTSLNPRAGQVWRNMVLLRNFFFFFFLNQYLHVA